jgi:hypothetical protein
MRLEERLSVSEKKIEAQESRISALEGRAATTEAKALSAFKCFAEIPLTRYGEETGPSGYLFNLNGPAGPQTLATTALDLSYPDDAVGAWIFVDACNKERLTSQSSLARYAARFVETGN